jgi:hypothetical protein
LPSQWVLSTGSRESASKPNLIEAVQAGVS